MKAGKGSFFAIDKRIWAKLAAGGDPKTAPYAMNEAVAYLVLAQGTGANHKSTSWSVNALKTHAGISWERGKSAVEALRQGGYIRHAATHTAARPRYELVKFGELAEIEAARLPPLDYLERELLAALSKGEQPARKADRKRAEDLVVRGVLTRDTQGRYRLADSPKDDAAENLLWLPNTIVTGTTTGEESPIRRLRAAGDIWALRLFVDLYFEHNLRDDGGISANRIWQKFERQLVGQQGIYQIWGFKPEDRWLNFGGSFAVHQQRPKTGEESAVWESFDLLERLGLVNFIPHLLENSSAQAEVIHPYGIGMSGEEPVETEVGNAAALAAQRMSLPTKLATAIAAGYRHFCPVLNTKPDAQMVGILRLRYRPHTSRTAAWYADLHQSAQIHTGLYKELADKAG